MRIVLAGLVVLASLTACGSEKGEPTVTGRWTEQRLSQGPGGDLPIGLAADGDDILMVVLEDGGVLHSYAADGGGDLEAGVPLETGEIVFADSVEPVRRDGTWWVVSTGGRVVDGDEDAIVFEPRVFRSDDGLTWERVDVSGIPSGVDISAVAVAGRALVAVGVKRNAVDTAGEPGFEAAAWRSDDGVTWAEVALPGVVSNPSYGEESAASHLTLVDDRLLAGGRLGRQAALWSSVDDGRTWELVEAAQLEGLFGVAGLASLGPTVLLSGTVREGEEGTFLISDDGGTTFSATDEQPAADGEGFTPLWAGGGRFFSFTEPDREEYFDPGVCYADLDACREPAFADVGYILASEDGQTWPIVDTSGLGVGDELAGIVGTDDGRVVMVHLDGKGLLVHTWTAGAPLPEGEPLAPPERVELVTVAEGEEPEPGVRYHAPLYTHCGMDWLYLGDTPWQRTDDGLEVYDEGTEDWPMAGTAIYGYATLVDGVVEYTVGEGAEAEVIATYEQTGVEPPGCA